MDVLDHHDLASDRRDVAKNLWGDKNKLGGNLLGLDFRNRDGLDVGLDAKIQKDPVNVGLQDHTGADSSATDRINEHV